MFGCRYYIMGRGVGEKWWRKGKIGDAKLKRERSYNLAMGFEMFRKRNHLWIVILNEVKNLELPKAFPIQGKC
jgi:hypothetical protein